MIVRIVTFFICTLLGGHCGNDQPGQRLKQKNASEQLPNKALSKSNALEKAVIDLDRIDTSQVTLGTYDEAFQQKYNQEFAQITNFWNQHQKRNEERTLIASQDLVISYNFRWGIMSMGTPNLLMLDLDYKDQQVGNKQRALAILAKYAKENQITFTIRETERGLHAFIVSKEMDPISEEAKKIMCHALSDIRYIAYCTIRGFCCRISPKPFHTQKVGPGSQLRSHDDIKTQFISRKPQKYIIGDPSQVKPKLMKLLQLNDDLVTMIYQAFTQNYDDMTSGTSTRGDRGTIAKTVLLNTLKPRIEQLIQQAGYPLIETYPLDKGAVLS